MRAFLNRVVSHAPWRRGPANGYRRGMGGLAPRPGDVEGPIPHLHELDKWVGCWVAVKDDQVLVAAETSHKLAVRLREMGPRGNGAVMQYVRPAEGAYIVGVG